MDGRLDSQAGRSAGRTAPGPASFQKRSALWGYLKPEKEREPSLTHTHARAHTLSHTQLGWAVETSKRRWVETGDLAGGCV